METFDPLSLFTPVLRDEPDVSDAEICGNGDVLADIDSEIPSRSKIDEMERYDQDDDFELDSPLHILDLPSLAARPPFVVLMILLRLLAPNETLNFGPSSADSRTDADDEETTVFTEKGLDSQMIDNALLWLEHRCSRLNSPAKLSRVPALALSLRNDHGPGYFSYMTRIVSSELEWITSELDRGILQKEASLRISENCGRTAQPEIIRKIVINGLSEIHSDDVIRLKEPTLTSDNLGLKTWGSSLILAQRLIHLNSKNHYLKSPVLELGSGTGLVGMASCILGHKTYLTDLKEIVPNLKDNVELNGIENAVVSELDWTDVSTFTLVHGDIKFPTILASDPIYLEQHPHFLMNAIGEMAAADRDTRVIVQIPLRPKYENERALLWNLMEEVFTLEMEEIEHGYDDFGEMSFCFRVYRFK